MSRFLVDSEGAVKEDSSSSMVELDRVFKSTMVISNMSFFEWIGKQWDKFVIKCYGKKLAVFGEREVGKTHLIHFLTTGSLPAEYRQTTGTRKVPGRRLSLGDLNFSVKSIPDMPGTASAYGEWKKVHNEADIVLYLLRADRLIAGDRAVECRVRNDFKQISGWLEECSSRPDFLIIGTHCDLDPEYQATSPGTFGNYCDKFRGLPIVDELITFAGGDQQAKIVLGSMKTVKDTEELVYRIFERVFAPEAS